MESHNTTMKVPPSDPELTCILEKSRGVRATEAELREQRISFAFGNALGQESITKESVRQSSRHVGLVY